MTKVALVSDRQRLRRLVRACGILLASTVISAPYWTAAQKLERRRMLRLIPRALDGK